ncbi:MAG: carboxymuconolactone decarboxylase family protein [Betaproteobacteria bacterium]|nr:carboxymuconolactone decarboxylase family protein [Betaproteobacteria bacterium]
MTTAKELAKKAADLQLVIDKYLPGTSRSRGVCPDADHIAAELMWGGIWNEPGLDHTLRSIATITAQAVNGFDFGLRHQCRVGLSLGIPPPDAQGDDPGVAVLDRSSKHGVCLSHAAGGNR